MSLEEAIQRKLYNQIYGINFSTRSRWRLSYK